MDLQPIQRPDQMMIQGYGKGGFRVSDRVHQGSVIVTETRVLPWSIKAIGDLDEASFDDLIAAGPLPEVILLGCGDRMALIPSALKKALRAKGLVIDPMDTGAACRTFNILLSEDRRVAACLVAI